MTLYCYNLIYNSATEEYEKHGTLVTSEELLSNNGIHSCGYYVTSSEDENELLNLSADSAVISANDKIETNVNNAISTSGDIQVSATNEEELIMKVTLVISVKSPIIKAKYTPNNIIKKTDVIVKNK